MLRTIAFSVLLICFFSNSPCLGIDDPAGTNDTNTQFIQRLQSLQAQSHLDSVVILVDENLAGARSANDESFLAELLILRGSTYVSTGRAPDAETDLREALDLKTAEKDTVGICLALRHLSRSVMRQRRYPEAEEIVDSLEKTAIAFKDSTSRGRALTGRARIRSRMRDLAAADSLYTLARPIFEAVNDSTALASTINGHGSCLARLGRYREAASLFDEASILATACGLPSIAAMARNNQAGISMILGDPGSGLAGYREARDIQLELGRWNRAARPWISVAMCLRKLGRYDEARSELDSALVFCQDHDFVDDEGMTLVRLGELANAQKNHDEARSRHEQCLALGPEVAKSTRATAFLRLSDIHLSENNAELALVTLDSAKVYLSGGRDFTLALSIELNRGHALRMVKKFPEAAECYREAGLYAERGKKAYRMQFLVGEARSWLEMAAVDSARTRCDDAALLWEDERSLPTDPRWRERRSISANLLFHTFIKTEMESSPNGQNSLLAFGHLQRYKARTLYERILGPGGTLPEDSDLPDLVNGRNFQNQILKPGELFLDFLTTTAGSYVFAVNRDTCIVRSFMEHTALAKQIEPFTTSLQSPFSSVDQTSGKEISEILFGDQDGLILAMVKKADTVFWSPDGPLHNLPLRLILPDSGNITCSRVPAAGVLSLFRNKSKSEVLQSRIFALAGSENDEHHRLNGALEEVSWLEENFKEVDVPVFESVEELSTNDFSQYGVLHLACHSIIDDQNPWNCTLVLGTDEKLFHLRAGEVAAMDLPAGFVFLSSCKSIGGANIAGEGSLGLSAAFLSAGVPTVLATLWPVDDQSTLVFVKEFYKQLSAGLTVTQALTMTQDIVRQEAATNHPFYWASFIVVGDGTAVVPVLVRSKPIFFVGFLMASGLVAGGWVLFRMRNRQ
ncbi:MAG: CHAT domain-containing protein [bacterium]|nr:CHAT domain-containing protein [bacterium]